MKLLIIILLILLLSSCESYRANNKTKWLRNHGYITTDTSFIKVFIPADSSKGQIDNLPDSFERIVERIIHDIKDTCISKQKVREIGRKAANQLNYPTQIDSNKRHYAEIWIESGVPKWKIIDKPIEKQAPCPPQISEIKETWWQRNKFWIGFVIGFASLFILDRLITKLFGKIIG